MKNKLRCERGKERERERGGRGHWPCVANVGLVNT